MSLSVNLSRPEDEPTQQAPRESGGGIGGWWGRSRSGRRAVLGLLLLAALLALAHRPLLTGFAHGFRVDDPAPSDAIVLLIGDAYGDRPLKAAELYRRGLAPRILMGINSPSTERNQALLQKHGVPADAIEVIPNLVESTHDEAMGTLEALRGHEPPVQRITVVTTAFHTARARWVFRKVLRDLGVEVRMAASQEPRFHEANWFTSKAGVDAYLREVVKTIYYRLAY